MSLFLRQIPNTTWRMLRNDVLPVESNYQIKASFCMEKFFQNPVLSNLVVKLSGSVHRSRKWFYRLPLLIARSRQMAIYRRSVVRWYTRTLLITFDLLPLILLDPLGTPDCFDYRSCDYKTAQRNKKIRR